MMPVIARSRFRGCLLGALAGDCIGRGFEFRKDIIFTEKQNNYQKGVVKLINSLNQGMDVKELEAYNYTDDTAMLRSVALSLLDCDGYDPKDMIWRFSSTYFDDASRGYGPSITNVFVRIRERGKDDIGDPYRPALSQFKGQGSLGNGGAMRVAPVALFNVSEAEAVAKLAKDQCQLTHTHPHGIMGTVMQAVAVWIALISADDSINANDFLSCLRKYIVAEGNEIYGSDTDNPYIGKIDQFAEMLDQRAGPRDIVDNLGNHITALESVPTAVYCFLQGLKPIPGISISSPSNPAGMLNCISCHHQSQNPLLRTIAGAVSLSGDTDTIASMAGAIAGGYYGDHDLPEWIHQLEGAADAVTMADRLYERYTSGLKAD